MKSFGSFHLDTSNHLLLHGTERIPLTPKAFDVLRYLVERAGRLVAQNELMEALWPETYVNSEVLRKYILEIRKALGDDPEKPEFVATITKRGYRFVATVIDDESPRSPTPQQQQAVKETQEVKPASDAAVRLTGHGLWPSWLLYFAAALVAMAAIAGYFSVGRSRPSTSSANETSLAVLPFADLSPGKDQEYFSDGLTEELISDLGRTQGLKVVARSSAFQFKGRSEDLRSVGKELGVANILEGSVRKQGDRAHHG